VIVRRLTTAAPALLAAAALAGVGAAPASAAGKPRVVKAVTSTTGAEVISATAICPKGAGGKGPWRALSGGFQMTTFSTAPGIVTPPERRAVVFESRRIGARSWRVSVQNLEGQVKLEGFANCQRKVPKPRAITEKILTPNEDRLGPSTVARCPSGRAVSGGFSTPPPFAAGEPANAVVDLFPTGTRAWKARVVSNRQSSLTTYAYCAKRKRKPKIKTANSDPQGISTATTDNTETFSSTGRCPPKRFAPGGGGFRQPDATPSQYLLPRLSMQRPEFVGRGPRGTVYGGNIWIAGGQKVGGGTPVALIAVALCG
jgi:hypothetical protein